MGTAVSFAMSSGPGLSIVVESIRFEPKNSKVCANPCCPCVACNFTGTKRTREEPLPTEISLLDDCFPPCGLAEPTKLCDADPASPFWTYRQPSREHPAPTMVKDSVEKTQEEVRGVKHPHTRISRYFRRPDSLAFFDFAIEDPPLTHNVLRASEDPPLLAEIAEPAELVSLYFKK